jgi:glycosyltransferase involved in cell wall biosynthesis
MLIEPVKEGVPIVNGQSNRKRILVCVPRYLPGYKSGGPVRAIANMVASLNGQFDFYVVTRDRDSTDAVAYPGVIPDRWHRIAGACVLYCSSVTTGIQKQAICQVQPDIISLNSFQEKFTRLMMMLYRMGALGNTPVLLAPRGEFSPGAMKIKKTKKDLYRRTAALLGLHEGLHWQVSSQLEKEDLVRAAPARSLDPTSIHVVREIIDVAESANARRPPKEAGAVKFVFISRVSEKKNLCHVLDLLPEITGNVEFDIYGPMADGDLTYWERCKASLEKAPGNVKVQYLGPLDHPKVPQALHDHHFFVLPTQGENFCHAAVESFINGTPAILSDQTPWVNLYLARAGFDIPLSDRAGWIRTLQSCVDMDQQTYDAFLAGTREYSRSFSNQEAIEQHVAMFEAILSQVGSGTR